MTEAGRLLVALALFSFHLAFCYLAIDALGVAWQLRLLLRLLLERSQPLGPFIVATGSAVWLAPIGIATAVLLSAVLALRTVWRLWRGQPERRLLLRLLGFAYVALACVMVNAFLFSTAESLEGPFRQRYVVLSSLSVPMCYSVYALWDLALPWLDRRLAPRLRRGLAVSFASVALFLVVGELGLRVAASVRPSLFSTAAAAPSNIRRDAERQAPGTLRYFHPINAGGHYDIEFRPSSELDGPLVVSIGDSFSYGVVPHAFHYTTVVERECPGVEIHNMGYPGLDPFDYLCLLEEQALSFAPDLLLIELYVGNDVASAPGPAGPPRWFDAGNYLSAVTWHRLALRRRIAEVPRIAISDDPAVLVDRLPWLADPMLEPPTLSERAYRDLSRQGVDGICTDNPEMVRRFFASLVALEEAAGDVPIAFVLIPAEFQVEDPLWEEIVEGIARPVERDLIQTATNAWMAERGRAVLDLLPSMRAVEPLEDGYRHLYHLRDTHFNARGNEVAGLALAGFVTHLLETGEALTRPPSEALPLSLDMGKPLARQFMRTGWSHDESMGTRSYVWSSAASSTLELRLPEEGDLRMVLTMHPLDFPGSPEQRVEVLLNGEEVADLPLQSGLRQYEVTLPQDALRERLDTLEFRYANVHHPEDVMPGSVDSRTLAVCWYTIQFTEPAN